jgi:hypothetical protein
MRGHIVQRISNTFIATAGRRASRQVAAIAAARATGVAAQPAMSRAMSRAMPRAASGRLRSSAETPRNAPPSGPRRCCSSVVEHSLGKGEVDSSILSSSTMISLGIQADRARWGARNSRDSLAPDPAPRSRLSRLSHLASCPAGRRPARVRCRTLHHIDQPAVAVRVDRWVKDQPVTSACFVPENHST